MNETLLKLNLSKGVVLDIQKKKGFEGQKSKIILCLDYSGSMQALYSRGFVQRVLARVLPVAMAMDDDGSIDVYIFHNDSYHVQPDLTVENLEGYIKNFITGKYSFGGTSYAPAIKQITETFLRDDSNTVLTTKEVSTGWFSKAKKIQSSESDKPGYVIFITDGENSDKDASCEAIKAASNHGLFFQFVGLDSDGCSFKFLKALDTLADRFVDNAGFFQITDSDLDSKDDEHIYSLLLSEYPSYLKAAEAKGIINKPVPALTTP